MRRDGAAAAVHGVAWGVVLAVLQDGAALVLLTSIELAVDAEARDGPTIIGRPTVVGQDRLIVGRDDTAGAVGICSGLVHLGGSLLGFTLSLTQHHYYITGMAMAQGVHQNNFPRWKCWMLAWL